MLGLSCAKLRLNLAYLFGIFFRSTGVELKKLKIWLTQPNLAGVGAELGNNVSLVA